VLQLSHADPAARRRRALTQGARGQLRVPQARPMALTLLQHQLPLVPVVV
jgi:hypothetical protein